MIITLWGLLISLGITGYMQGTDRYFGEEWLMDLHHQLANSLMFAVAVHIVAIFALSFWKKKALLRAMLWG
jgi:cytochrome b